MLPNRERRQRQSISWRCPLSQAHTKRIGVTSLLRPSSYWNLLRPLLSRSCQRTKRRRLVVLAPEVFVFHLLADEPCREDRRSGRHVARHPLNQPTSAVFSRSDWLPDQGALAPSESARGASSNAALEGSRRRCPSCPIVRARPPRLTALADRSSPPDRRSKSTGLGVEHSWSCEIIPRSRSCFREDP